LIIVTGGAGFIGSNIVRGLNEDGMKDIVVVDDLSDGRKFGNLVNVEIADYLDKDEFAAMLESGRVDKPEAIIHQGACAVTTEWNGRYMMDTNFRYSKLVYEYCRKHRVALIYASSAAVYGISRQCEIGNPANERPLNVYGYSKLLFDRYVTRIQASGDAQVVGLRYFNVYGPGESHKGPMASVAWHLHGQVRSDGEARLFEGSDGYADGEQRRDFVHVDDVVEVNLWFLRNRDISGIFNVGTGQSASFNEVASAVIDWHGRGEIRYIPFPDELRSRYQSFTEADISTLRDAGYTAEFSDVATGVPAYLDAINAE
jgi:ADP-L-glycero-D-manno-heptose 6-epimerase